MNLGVLECFSLGNQMITTRSSPKAPSAVQIKAIVSTVKKLAENGMCVLCPEVDNALVQPIFDLESLPVEAQREAYAALCNQLGHTDCKYSNNKRHGYMTSMHACKTCSQETHVQRAITHLSMPGDGCPTHIHRYRKRQHGEDVESGDDSGNETMETPPPAKKLTADKNDSDVLDLLTATFVHGTEFMTVLRDQITKGIGAQGQNLSSGEILSRVKHWSAVDKDNAALRRRIDELTAVHKASCTETDRVIAVQKAKIAELERAIASQKTKLAEAERAVSEQKPRLDDYAIVTKQVVDAGYTDKASEVVKKLLTRFDTKKALSSFETVVPSTPKTPLDDMVSAATRRSHEGMSANNGKH